MSATNIGEQSRSPIVVDRLPRRHAGAGREEVLVRRCVRQGPVEQEGQGCSRITPPIGILHLFIRPVRVFENLNCGQHPTAGRPGTAGEAVPAMFETRARVAGLTRCRPWCNRTPRSARVLGAGKK